MIEAVAQGFFGHDYTILQGGREVGTMHTRAWGRGAQARVDGREVVFDRVSFWAREFSASLGGVEFGHAHRPRRFFHSIEFTSGDRTYELGRSGFFRHEFVIRHQNLRIGMIRSSRLGHRHITVESPSEWPLELSIFALWLAIMMWKRRAAAVAAAGGA